MTDRATPNLPSREFEATFQFYRQFGFLQSWRDDDWMILKLRELFLSCFRIPCLTRQRAGSVARPTRESWGGLVGALIDIEGTLLWLIQE